ncbi:MAG: hypothetical protein KAJ52_04070 [Sedimentisphaerales bacterium]|nr:hypothetical protein [Sedimentisphaerales bacterium]
MKREFVRLYCVLSVLCCVCLSGVLWADEPIRIMPMGDSVTSGVYALGIPEEADMISYRYELYNMLNTVGYEFDFIGSRVYGENIFSDAENASVPGISPYQLAYMIRTGWNQKISVWETPGPYFDTYPTDIVLLLTGIAGFNINPSGVIDVLDAIDESSEDIVVILGLIPNVMCCTDSPPCDRCVDVPIFNDALELAAMARIANGDKIVIVDMETGAGLDYREQPVGDMYNSLHPVRSGYDKMAPVWYDALKTVLPEMDPFAPQFTTTNAITHVDVDTVYKYYSYAVGNPDPCYAILEGPEGMTFDPCCTRLLQWTPTIADLGPHPVTIAASNSEGVALQSFDLYVTLQSVMDATSEGGVIVVPQGIYRENIDFKGKNLVVVSTDPCNPIVVANTVILGDGFGPVVTFSGAESSACRLSGFTITGGHAFDITVRGGGICGNGTIAAISHCVIEDNLCDSTGGGVHGYNGTISHCVIRNNTSRVSGGAIAGSSMGEMFNCIISDNIADGQGGPGVDSASALHSYDGDIVNCTIAGNIGPGDIIVQGCDGSFTNCIIWGNSGNEFDFHTAVMNYCCWPGGSSGTGNLAVDPCFITGPLGDYYLSQSSAGQSDTSPCVDTGSDTAANLELDVLGTCTDGAMDTGTVDMGYHYIIPFPVDINKDWEVNLEDYALLSQQWLDSPGVPSADIAPPGGDGVVDSWDLLELAENWLWWD